MLRLEWVEEQIARLKADTCTLQNVRDYALLCIARDSLRGEVNPPSPRDRMADELEGTPTIEQVEKALGVVMVNSNADRKRVQDAMTWVKIFKGEG